MRLYYPPCGILFAAPCGVLVMGFTSKKIFGNLSIVALALGVGMGFFVWLMEVESGISWFYGTLLSFSCPVVFLWISGLIKGKDFNMTSLKW
jgi:hypothetical protein